jgi:hypothetical protein
LVAALAAADTMPGTTSVTSSAAPREMPGGPAPNDTLNATAALTPSTID